MLTLAIVYILPAHKIEDARHIGKWRNSRASTTLRDLCSLIKDAVV